MTLLDFVARIEHARPKDTDGFPGYVGRCPACALDGGDSKGTHLLVSDKSDGWLHVSCITKQHGEDEIFRAAGLSPEDRRIMAPERKRSNGKPPSIPPTKTSKFIYTDTYGQYRYEKVKIETFRLSSDGRIVREKDFHQRVTQVDGKPATKVPTKKGDGLRWPFPKEAGISDFDTTFYRLHELMPAIQSGKTIYINEGELACDVMAKAGFAATCLPGGADFAGSALKPEHIRVLQKAKCVVIVADRDPSDKPGEAFASGVAARLAAAGVCVRVVQSKTTGVSDDARDHFEAGFSADDFIERPDLMAIDPDDVYALDVPAEHTYEEEVPRYLWEPYLHLEQLNILDAKGGAGKTTFCLAVAAQLSNGYLPWIGECVPARTLYFGKEDTPGALLTKYRKCGGKDGFFYPYDKAIQLDDGGLRSIEATIRKLGAKLVVFDAIGYYMSSLIKNPLNAMEIEPILSKLRDVARRTGCCILLIRHFKKGTAGSETEDMGAGVEQWRNSTRSQLVLRPHPDRLNHPQYAIIQHVKGSINSGQGEAFGFQFVEDRLQWVPPSQIDLSVFDVVTTGKAVCRMTPDEICDWLRRRLVEGPQGSDDLMSEAKSMGIGKNAVWKAKDTIGALAKRVGVQGEKGGGKWFWGLPREPQAPTSLPYKDDGEEYDPFNDE